MPVGSWPGSLCILRFEKYFTSSFGDKTPFYSFCFDYSFFKANDGKLLERILMGFFLFFQIKAKLSAHSSGQLEECQCFYRVLFKSDK